MEINKIYLGDCLEIMKHIKDKSIDMILCDLPYGVTKIPWDSPLNLDTLWKEYKRVINNNGIIVLTAIQPFTTTLINSNKTWFKYELIWDKRRASNFLHSKKRPMQIHENILIFYNVSNKFNPQFTKKDITTIKRQERKLNSKNMKTQHHNIKIRSMEQGNKNYPTTIIYYKKETNNQFRKVQFHPTQKPVALFEYLIQTYSNEGDLVLDNCIGSGTTAIACIRTNRNFIGIEKEEKYVEIANKRIKEELLQPSLLNYALVENHEGGENAKR